MTSIVSTEDQPKLSRPHVGRAWFGVFDFPDGIQYLHNGEGPVVIDGNTYLGVSDVLGGRLVSISQVEAQRFGQANAVTIVLSGASKEFIQSVRATARDLEGRAATIYWAMVDPETEEVITDLIPVFARGKMSAPSTRHQGIGVRYVTLTIEDMWSSQNFAPGGRWNSSGFLQRHAGDKGGEFIGVAVDENWQ